MARLFSLLFVTLAFLSVTVESSLTADKATVVPNFWDPRVRLDKPSEPVRTIGFLASDDFPPFAFRDPAGRITGFNVDLARAVCDELGAICTLRIKPFAELAAALDSGDGDAVIAGLTPGVEPPNTLIFSDTYLKLPARFVTRKQETEIDELTPEALAGKWISVATGTAHAAFLERFFADSRIATYPSPDDARAALKRGEVEAHFGDGLSLSYWLQGTSSAGCCVFAPGPWLEPHYFDNGLSIAFRAEDTRLKAAVDYALQQVHADGRYRELYLRYFPISFF